MGCLRIIEATAGDIILQKEFDKNNFLVFLLGGEAEIFYGNLKPKIMKEGNVILLASLSNYVCKAHSSCRVLLLEIRESIPRCDKSVFQQLFAIFSLIKYDFQEIEIRPPLKLFLDLLSVYFEQRMMNEELLALKMEELMVLFRCYYNPEELTMLFYPLLGKNMEFRKMVTDHYAEVRNAKEYATICGYSQGVFQRKFKEVFGETVYRWMQRQKAEQIKHRLMVTDVNPKLLAEEFDFTSPAHLNKFCKIWFGMTPSELRQTYLLKKSMK